MHLDGARLMNAVVASGHAASEMAQHFDTVSICFSKGLGAPVGSALAGSADAIRRARRLRKLFGGGMRQAGILAAGALYALENNVDRLSEDHANARLLAEAFAGTDGFELETGPVETNLVWVKIDSSVGTAAEVAAFLRSRNILVTVIEPQVHSRLHPPGRLARRDRVCRRSDPRHRARPDLCDDAGVLRKALEHFSEELPVPLPICCQIGLADFHLNDPHASNVCRSSRRNRCASRRLAIVGTDSDLELRNITARGDGLAGVGLAWDQPTRGLTRPGMSSLTTSPRRPRKSWSSGPSRTLPRRPRSKPRSGIGAVPQPMKGGWACYSLPIASRPPTPGIPQSSIDGGCQLRSPGQSCVHPERSNHEADPATLATTATPRDQDVRPVVELCSSISFLILFLELACIRWLGSIVIFLTYFTNIVLMACFLGVSVGLPGFGAAVIMDQRVHSPGHLAAASASGSLDLRASTSHGRRRLAELAAADLLRDRRCGSKIPSQLVMPIEVLAGYFFALIALIFVGLGQEMGRRFAAIENRLLAYSVDILGSLAGIVGLRR